MSFNPQTPFFYTALNSSNNVVTISNARAITILSTGGTTDVVNSTNQTLTIPSGSTLSIEADSGNTISTLTITPKTGATAYVTMLGGNGSMV